MYNVISFETNRIVYEGTCYQDAAKKCNELDDQWKKEHPQFISGKLPHTLCHKDFIDKHESKYGKLSK